MDQSPAASSRRDSERALLAQFGDRLSDDGRTRIKGWGGTWEGLTPDGVLEILAMDRFDGGNPVFTLALRLVRDGFYPKLGLYILGRIDLPGGVPPIPILNLGLSPQQLFTLALIAPPYREVCCRMLGPWGEGLISRLLNQRRPPARSLAGTYRKLAAGMGDLAPAMGQAAAMVLGWESSDRMLTERWELCGRSYQRMLGCFGMGGQVPDSAGMAREAISNAMLFDSWSRLQESLCYLVAAAGPQVEVLFELAEGESPAPAALRAIGVWAQEADLEGRSSAYLALRPQSDSRTEVVRRAATDGLQILARSLRLETIEQLDEWMAAEDLAEGGDDSVSERRTWLLADRYLASISSYPPRPEVQLIDLTKGQHLTTIPRTVRRSPEFPALQAALEEADDRWTRAARVFERCLLTGTSLSGYELDELCGDPIVSRALSGVLLEVDGFRLLATGGEPQGAWIKRKEIRVPHPVVLEEEGELAEWRRGLCQARLVQPFPQLFREIHPPAPSELHTAQVHRFSGVPVVGRTARSLTGARGHRKHPDKEDATTFRIRGQMVRMCVSWLPDLEQQGTIHTGPLWFEAHPEEGWGSIPVSEVPPWLVSEYFREMTLLISGALESGQIPPDCVVAQRIELLRAVDEAMELGRVLPTDDKLLVAGHQRVLQVCPGSAAVVTRDHSQALTVPDGLLAGIYNPYRDEDPISRTLVGRVLAIATGLVS